MFNRKTVAVVITALTLSCSVASQAADTNVLAPATVPASAPLAPGHAAGVREAQDTAMDNTLLVVGGLTIVGVGVALLVSDNGHHSSSATTTTLHPH